MISKSEIIVSVIDAMLIKAASTLKSFKEDDRIQRRVDTRKLIEIAFAALRFDDAKIHGIDVKCDRTTTTLEMEADNDIGVSVFIDWMNGKTETYTRTLSQAVRVAQQHHKDISMQQMMTGIDMLNEKASPPIFTEVADFGRNSCFRFRFEGVESLVVARVELDGKLLKVVTFLTVAQPSPLYLFTVKTVEVDAFDEYGNYMYTMRAAVYDPKLEAIRFNGEEVEPQRVGISYKTRDVDLIVNDQSTKPANPTKEAPLDYALAT